MNYTDLLWLALAMTLISGVLVVARVAFQAWAVKKKAKRNSKK